MENNFSKSYIKNFLFLFFIFLNFFTIAYSLDEPKALVTAVVGCPYASGNRCFSECCPVAAPCMATQRQGFQKCNLATGQWELDKLYTSETCTVLCSTQTVTTTISTGNVCKDMCEQARRIGYEACESGSKDICIKICSGIKDTFWRSLCEFACGLGGVALCKGSVDMMYSQCMDQCERSCANRCRNRGYYESICHSSEKCPPGYVPERIGGGGLCPIGKYCCCKEGTPTTSLPGPTTIITTTSLFVTTTVPVTTTILTTSTTISTTIPTTIITSSTTSTTTTTLSASCIGRCGVYDPNYPCQCDPQCRQYKGSEGCCPDICRACYNNISWCHGSTTTSSTTTIFQQTTTTVQGTCAGRCGRYGSNYPCQCDIECRQNNDCCGDICRTCPEMPWCSQQSTTTTSTTTTVQSVNSCRGRCGDYNPNYPCQCDEYCKVKGDCCRDICRTCPNTTWCEIPVTTSTTLPQQKLFSGYNFRCEKIIDGHKCILDYNNQLGENAVIIFFFVDEKNSLVNSPVYFANQGTGSGIGLLYCKYVNTGKYYVLWRAYRESDKTLSNEVAWSKSYEVQNIVC